MGKKSSQNKDLDQPPLPQPHYISIVKIIAVTLIILFILYIGVKPFMEKLISLSTLSDLKGYGIYLGVAIGSWIGGYLWPNISFFPRN